MQRGPFGRTMATLGRNGNGRVRIFHGNGSILPQIFNNNQIWTKRQ